VLDNVEHPTAAVPPVAELLAACPQLKAPVTSRAALGVPGEHGLPVPPLTLPKPEDDSDPAALARCDAVALFVQRARAVKPDFALSAGNGRAVSQICRRLDGLPLALELAAARVTVLTPDEIAARLDDRFGLLTAGSATVAPRHRTLRALVDWSYDLLSEAERALLRRLTVFAGSGTLKAAEAICAGDGLDRAEILDLLAALVDKSPVLAEAGDGETRYRLLETLCQYGLETLREAGEEAALRSRHRNWFLDLAERAEPWLWGADQVAWLARLDAELDNLRAALDWTRAEGAASRAAGPDRDRPTTAIRFSWALVQLWHRQGCLSDGRERLRELLALAPERTAVRVDILNAAGFLASLQGDLPAARASLEAGLEAARALGYAYDRPSRRRCSAGWRRPGATSSARRRSWRRASRW